jgi:hypothetical protein
MIPNGSGLAHGCCAAAVAGKPGRRRLGIGSGQGIRYCHVAYRPVAAGILTGSGSELAFRHLLIQQALYGNMPTALTTALHAEAARELAAAGADALGGRA